MRRLEVRFRGVIVAVASFLFDFVLNIALIPMNTYWGVMVVVIVSILVSGLIVGYVFAGSIREKSKMASMGKIVVLFAVVIVFSLMMVYSITGHYSAVVDETFPNSIPLVCGQT